ncbi:Ig-like domain-containing protein [Shewanella frigidimarina]|uniref:Fibronectin type-III domain-containing protein n=1 Tax=Shewanella frigidimarina TaxID=56812 RepID=A0A119D083_SHEFR|nr:Ig-like domain-containing protein [Shewanella frigidimarina]KVX02525.1 hypothetical protein AWJ07_13485 [Shewanella frigidimarina]
MVIKTLSSMSRVCTKNSATTWLKLCLVIFFMAVTQSAWAVTPGDENYDDNAIADVATSNGFPLDEVKYTLTGSGTYRNTIENSNGSPLGDNGTDHYLFIDKDGVGNLSSVKIEAADGSAFQLSGFSFDGVADGSITVTPNGGSALSYTRNGIYSAELNIDTSSNPDFQNITSVIFAGSNLSIAFDDLNFEPAVLSPTIISAAYNAAAGTLVLTATNMQALGGAANDIDASKLTFTGEGTYTLTDTSDVDISSASTATLTLSATDKAAINSQITNKNGTASTGGTTYNLAAADDWNAAVTDGNTADLTSNVITASGVAAPTITSATYNASTGVFSVTATNLSKRAGATNDIVANKFTLTGESGSTYTYTLTDTANVEISSATAFTLTLSATDKAAINSQITNKNGTASTDGTTYNLAGATGFIASSGATADLTGNGITVSNVPVPTISYASYSGATGIIAVTGSGLVKADGAANDIVASTFTITGQGGATATLTDTANVEITDGESFSLTLSATDKSSVDSLLNKNGTQSNDATTYNLAAAEDWSAGSDAAVNVADLTLNGITVSNTVTVPGAPTIGTATAGNSQASITFSAPASNGGSAITGYTVTASSGGFTGTGTSSPIVVTGLTNSTAYTFTVTATNAVGTGSASGASNSVTPKAPQTITFGNPGAQAFGTSPTLSATSTSSLVPTFSSSTAGVCTITSGGALTFVTAGSCTIDADQAGDGSYLAATTVTQSFTVNAVVPGAPTAATATAGDTQASVTFTAPASTGGAAISGYTVTSNPGGATGSAAGSPISVTGLTNGTAYTFTVTATNSAGTGAASGASGSITPAAGQTITFANPGAQDFGTTPTLTATASSSLTPTFTSSTTGVCTITSGGTLTFVAAGTCTIDANQAGNGSYSTAPTVTRSFTVNPVVSGAPTAVTATAGDTQASVAFSAPVFTGGAVITSYTVTSSPGGLTGAGAGSPINVPGLTNGAAYTFTVTATNGAGNSSVSTASSAITPAATQSITFGNPGAQNFGASPTLSATADSALTPTFTSTTTGICTITSGGTLTFVTAGTCSINADQAGNSAYLAAVTVTQSFAVNAVLAGAPTVATATAGDTQASVTFSAPVFTGGAAVTGYTVTSSPGGITSAGSGSPIAVTGLTNGTAYTFTVTATNPAGISIASTASNSVTPQVTNSAPVISGSPTTTVAQNSSYSFAPTANDVDGNTLSFSVSNKPAWAIFSTTTGALTGTPVEADVGVTSGIIISVSDGTLTAALPAFSITVTAVNVAPVISGTPATAVNQDEAYSFTPTASDDDTETTLSFSISNKPSWASFDTATGALTGTPVKADVGVTSGIIVSVSDGALTAELPAFNLEVINVNEAPNAIDDNLTLPFSISNVYQLDVLANDTDADADELTISTANTNIGNVQVLNNQLQFTAPENFSGLINLSYSITDGELNASANVSLQIDGSNPDAPVITVPDDLSINATGLFTKVNVGVAIALDRNGNRLPVQLDKNTLLFAPGEHPLYWSATDAEGVSSTTTQLLHVQPLVSLSKAQTVVNHSAVTVDIILNGEAPSYPVDVGYSVSGSAGAGDHDLVDGTVQITSGLRASVSFNVFADLNTVAAKDLIIALSSGPNLTANASTTVTVTDTNIAPKVKLTVQQQGTATSLVTPTNGPVTLLATVTDGNEADTHTFVWTAPAMSLPNADTATITLDPVGLSGVQTAAVSVTDSAGATVEASVNFRIISTLPVLASDADTDKDGINDLQEGAGDSDGNGIPNYLDNMPSSNILPQVGNLTGSYLLECDPGVRCGLGRFALAGQSGGVQILNSELGTGMDIPIDPSFTPVGGIFDFEIADLPTLGQQVRIVIPQQAPIPAGGVYRKYRKGQWVTFITNANNSMHSAAGSPGYCPPPGAVNWQQGLTEGHYCVQLTIEDGGPNDDDGLVNGAVADPGGIAIPSSSNQLPLASIDSYNLQWNQTHQLNVLDNDTDADNDTLTITQASAAFGAVVVNDDGQSLWYTPAMDFIGTDTLSYTIIDDKNGSASTAVNVTLYYNSAPTLSNSSASTDDQTAITINVLSNAADADGDTLSITSASAQTGSVSITAEQQLHYTPKGGFSGTDVISVQISDGRGGVASADVSVSVTLKPQPVEPTPVKSSGGSFGAGLLALLGLLLVTRRRKHATA